MDAGRDADGHRLLLPEAQPPVQEAKTETEEGAGIMSSKTRGNYPVKDWCRHRSNCINFEKECRTCVRECNLAMREEDEDDGSIEPVGPGGDGT